MSELSNPHDRFFKEAFSRPETARNLLETYLPADVAAALDLETLSTQKESFIDADLETQQADLLYQVTAENGRSAYAYILLEHKSYPDADTPLQLLRYIIRIWERDRRRGVKELRPILPLVLYHGRARWPVPREFGDLFPGPDPLRAYWPAFRYHLLDLSPYSDIEIKGAVLSQAALSLFHHLGDPDFAERLPDIFRLLREMGDAETAQETLRAMLRYIAAAGEEISEPIVANALHTAFADETGDEIMPTLAEKWIEQGREQGVQQGVRDSILDLLSVRFGEAPLTMAEQLREIDDAATLRRLLRRAATVESLEDFGRALETAVSS
jgi:predicted transposase/invertase (TIGR01784 family)